MTLRVCNRHIKWATIQEGKVVYSQICYVRDLDSSERADTVCQKPGCWLHASTQVWKANK